MTSALDTVPELRIRRANDRAIDGSRDVVVYWMIATRRTRWNFALERALAWARALSKPVLVLEALRVGYPWASDRLHRFVLDGMADNERELSTTGVLYYPYVEPRAGAGKGLLAAVAERACVVVTDDFPCFFLPRMVSAAAKKVRAAVEMVDSSGLLPLAASDKDFFAASHFRRHVQQRLPAQLAHMPASNPFARWRPMARYRMPVHIVQRWPRASSALLAGDPAELAALPIDHEVAVAPIRGGSAEARRRLRRFIARGLAAYATMHAEPAADGTSRLSPYLHFGHVSAHEVVTAVMRAEDWTPDRLRGDETGARRGWWGMSEGAEAFLDQLVVWRELAYNTCAKRPRDYDRYESLPAWALETLEAHRSDPRPYEYTRSELERARTHDALWNAAQRQLRSEGWFHNYMRMLWGKKILEWSRSPREALATMIHIMNRWSLDGRDPNAYAGYFWTLGRYDRPWPERPVFGKVRSMSSERTAAKVDVSAYLERYKNR